MSKNELRFHHRVFAYVWFSFWSTHCSTSMSIQMTWALYMFLIPRYKTSVIESIKKEILNCKYLASFIIRAHLREFESCFDRKSIFNRLVFFWIAWLYEKKKTLKSEWPKQWEQSTQKEKNQLIISRRSTPNEAKSYSVFLVQYHPFQPLSLECRHSIRLETNRRQTSIDAFFVFLFYLFCIRFFFRFFLLSFMLFQQFVEWFHDFQMLKLSLFFSAFLHYIFYHKNFCRICTNIRTHNKFRINFGKPNILTMWIFTFLSIFHKYLHSIWRLDLSILLYYSVCSFFSLLTKWVCAFIVIRIPYPCIKYFDKI